MRHRDITAWRRPRHRGMEYAVQPLMEHGTRANVSVFSTCRRVSSPRDVRRAAFGNNETKEKERTIQMRKRLLLSTAALVAGVAIASAQNMPGGGQSGGGMSGGGAAQEHSQSQGRGGQAQERGGQAQERSGQAQERSKQGAQERQGQAQGQSQRGQRDQTTGQ